MTKVHVNKALTVTPHQKNSLKLIEVPKIKRKPNELLVEMLRVGVCGTDREIIESQYGDAPKGSDYLILGHESLGRVLEAPKNSHFKKGDHVVGIVRHPDPVPCRHCSIGEWDMCTNGKYTEHGIKNLQGFCQTQYTLDPNHAVKVPVSLGEAAVLLEPATILAKAWEHLEKIGERAYFAPTRVLVTGAGPVGLLAALMGRQRNLEVTIFDHHWNHTLKKKLTEKLGATAEKNPQKVFGASLKDEQKFDIVIECTGAGELWLEVVKAVRPGGIVCLTGISSGGRKLSFDPGKLNRSIVLENEVVFGSVNANRRHYQKALVSLEAADPTWLTSLITERTPLRQAVSAFGEKKPGIKHVITGAKI
jgi:threonine dehydrogenase-like Zn-dependent dehydrogenase